jgi:glycosyltransferase involved in cell wall biosynthesis
MTKLTIITSTLNVADSIKFTIESLRNQTSKNFQWIIVDGGSTDGSIEVYKKNSELIDICIIEDDSGIYEAWNKGLKFVQGQWIIFLGAGDQLESDDVIEKLLNGIRSIDDSIQFVCGDIYMVEKSFRKKLSGGVSLSSWDLGLPMLPPHPAILHRADLFDGNNKFDQSYKIAADSKFLIEYMNEKNTLHMDIVITNMIFGGLSSRPESWNLIKIEKSRIRKELKLNAPSFSKKLLDLKLHIKPIIFFIFGKKVSKFISNYMIRR